MKSLDFKMSPYISCQAASVSVGVRVNFLMLMCNSGSTQDTEFSAPRAVPIHWKSLGCMFPCLWLPRIVGSAPTLLKGTSVGWSEVTPVFPESLPWQVNVKEQKERELSHVLTLKCWDSFERILQDNDFKIKLGHGVSHRALQIPCGWGLWGVLSLCLPIMNFTSMWDLSALLYTLKQCVSVISNIILLYHLKNSLSQSVRFAMASNLLLNPHLLNNNYDSG